MEHNIRQVIVVRRDCNMRKGKIASQVAHASMQFLLDNNLSEDHNKLIVDLTKDEAAWIEGIFTKIVVSCDSESELEQLILKAQVQNVPVYPIIDCGFTEFHGIPTLTVAAFGPAEKEELDQITGHLKLL
jgi:peptidyl-tRNA hydrolase, PTH2 family